MPRHLRGSIYATLDAILVAGALWIALALRFDGQIPPAVVRHYILVAPWVALVSTAALNVAGVHRVIWRYAGLHALVDITRALSITSLALGIVNLLPTPQLFPRSVPFIFWMLQLLLVGGVRLAGRLSSRRRPLPAERSERRGRKRVLVFGAGDVGEALVRDLMRGRREDWEPVGFVDDDPGKQGRTIHGLRVRGATMDIPKLARQLEVDDVIIAAPSAPSTLVSSIFRCCQEHGIGCKTVPSLSDYVVGKSPLSQVREVRIEDLLGREPVEIDMDEVGQFLRGRSVLVTGAGGSIGSELCRQIARFQPGRLVALDHDENKLLYMSLELRRDHPELDLVVVVGDVKERNGIRHAFGEHRPQVIFHAAAHKHVNFMESNPRAAILNNVLGTRIVAEEAVDFGVRHFVLISTDKAVNPTNVMGASKRLCEKIVKALSETQDVTTFNAVRFGNVLGSAGSVIPIFRKQIAGGGPVTITHPEARRYFMTIPEASQLVIQAGAFGQKGTVFVLDMGEQVRVLDVARQLIRLSGFAPDRDVPITFIGLRPGEKLYEELLTDSERTTASVHRKILIWESDPEDWSTLAATCAELVTMADSGAVDAVKAKLAEIVPEYRIDEPVVALTDTESTIEAAVPTRRFDDRYALPHDLRPLRESPVTHVGRAVARVLIAVPALVGVSVLSLAHLIAAPGASVFASSDRIGRNRRSGPRRMFSSTVPIDRRGRDRRLRNLYGRPFRRVQFNVTPRPTAGRVERGFYAFLVRHRLHTLPSVIHVLKGEMALIGPRALSPAEIEAEHAVDEVRRRFVVHPGVTGLTHVLAASGRLSPTRAVEIDKFYVSHRSLGLDLRILTRTFGVVLAGNQSEPLRLRDRLGVGTPSPTRLDAVGDQS